jgi:hypothetical protein
VTEGGGGGREGVYCLSLREGPCQGAKVLETNDNDVLWHTVVCMCDCGHSTRTPGIQSPDS